MARRNRSNGSKQEEQRDPLLPGQVSLLDERPEPGPELEVRTVPEPKPIQVVPARTEVLERFAATLPLQDQMPFIVEQRLATNHRTMRRTRAEWQRLYDEYRTRPRY